MSIHPSTIAPPPSTTFPPGQSADTSKVGGAVRKDSGGASVNPLRGVCCYCEYVYREGVEPSSHGACGPCDVLLARKNVIGRCLYCTTPTRGFFDSLECRSDYWQRERENREGS